MLEIIRPRRGEDKVSVDTPTQNLKLLLDVVEKARAIAETSGAAWGEGAAI